MDLQKEFFKELVSKGSIGDNWTIDDIKKCVCEDYSDLIDLRNRIADGTDNDTTLYEEDHITLDHILDYMEILMEFLNWGRIK